ncbi:8665_t:CDS:2 [Entrophospora sp. SA101]|nr:8665_t:CDS:2 [Entrophospora sp. SA101]
MVTYQINCKLHFDKLGELQEASKEWERTWIIKQNLEPKEQKILIDCKLKESIENFTLNRKKISKRSFRLKKQAHKESLGMIDQYVLTGMIGVVKLDILLTERNPIEGIEEHFNLEY